MTEKSFTVRAIADLLGAEIRGNENLRIESVAGLDEAGQDDLTFAVDNKYARRLRDSRAGAAIVDKVIEDSPMTLLVVENVEAAVATVLGAFAGDERKPPMGIDAMSAVSPEAEVADDAYVGPGVVIGPRAKVGAGVALHANVCIGPEAVIGEQSILDEGVVVRGGCLIGRRVRIGPNSVIGSEGFGYYSDQEGHHKIPHIGNVVIEDDVEIGACSCVDRAKFGSTRIGAGTKIDNLVQIAHNVQVGRGCLLCGQVGIAGSAKLGNYVVAAGHAGIRDGVTIGDRVQCSGFAAVRSDVGDGQIVAGIPAKAAKEKFREVKSLERLPDLIKRVRTLETRLKAIEPPKDD